MSRKHPVGMDQALAILRGAGVKIDIKEKTQTYIVGMPLSKKIVEAGAILDQQFVYNEKGEDPQMEWKTIWKHAEDCACRDCIVKRMKEAKRDAQAKARAKAAKKKGAAHVGSPKAK